MKNRTIKSAIYNQLGKNKVIRHIKPMIKYNGKIKVLASFIFLARADITVIKPTINNTVAIKTTNINR